MDAQLHPPPSALSKMDTALDPFGWKYYCASLQDGQMPQAGTIMKRAVVLVDWQWNTEQAGTLATQTVAA